MLQWPTWAHKCNLPLFTKKRLRVSWIKKFPLKNNDWLNTGVHFLSLSLTFPQNSLAASKGHRLVCDICALKKHNSPLSQRFLNVHDDLHNRYCRGEDEGSFSLCLEKTKKKKKVCSWKYLLTLHSCLHFLSFSFPQNSVLRNYEIIAHWLQPLIQNSYNSKPGRWQ